MNVFRQLRALPHTVRVLFVATLINRTGTMVLPYLALYITQQLRADSETAGAVLASYGMGAIVAPAIAGRLVDRYGALRLMRASLVGSGIILLSYPFAHGTATLVGLTFVLSLVAEAFRPASLAVVAGAVPAAQRKTAFAVIRFAINLGMSIGPAVGGLLVAVSFQSLFYIDGATSIAAGILLTAVRWSDAGAAAPLTGSTVDAANQVPVEEGAVTGKGTGRAFAVFLLASFLLAVVFFQFESSLPLFVVRDVHASEAFYGALIAINAIIIIFAEIPLNLKMDAWSHPRSMAVGALFCAIGFGVLALGKSVPLVVASVPLWTIGEMIVLPATSAFVSDLAPDGRSGSYLGLSGTAFGLGFAVGPYVGIYALDHFGSAVLWTGTFVVGAIAASLFASLADASASPSPAGGK
jgi:MFS family permease